MKKVNIEDLYVELAERYSWTFDYIADMNPRQKLRAYNGPRFVKLTDTAAFQQWQSNRR